KANRYCQGIFAFPFHCNKIAAMPRTANTQHATRNTKKLGDLLLSWFAQNARDLPWRRTSDPYAIWVSEIMLQQTQVKTVIPYWERWMKYFPTVEHLAKARLEQVLKLWEGLGYYSRARNLHRAAQILVHQHDGVFPHKFESMLALPGV